MKNSYILVLYKLGLIPQFLIDGWESVTNIGAVNGVGKRLNGDRFALQVIGIVSLVCALLMLALGISHEPAYRGPIVLGLILIAVSLLFLICAFVLTWKMHPFTEELAELRNILHKEKDWDWKELVNTDRANLQGVLVHILCYKAAVVRYAEEQYDIGSPQAKEARLRFDRIHTVTIRFDLVSNKKNEFYDRSDEFNVRKDDIDWMASMAAPTDPWPQPAKQ